MTGIRGAQRWQAVRLDVRAAALLPLAALVVHQLRYRLAYGHDTHAELAAQGHGYLTSLWPLAVACAAAAAGIFAVRVAGAWAGRTDPAGSDGHRGTLWRTWLCAAAVLFAVFCVQELAEGMLAPGHAAGLAAVLSGGGWIAAPLSLAVGGVLALLLGAAEATLVRAAAVRGAAPRTWTPSTAAILVAAASPARAPRTILATRAAERAPPLPAS